MKTSLKIVLGLVVILIVGIAVWMVTQPQPTSVVNTAITQNPVTTTAIAPTTLASASKEVVPTLLIGQADAPVTIIEYADFQCPNCGRFFKQTEPKLREAYINQGKAKIEFRIFPYIGEESVSAGQAAYCANDQGKFVAYHDGLFTLQKGENDGTFNNQALKKLASTVGLQAEAFNTCLDTGKYKQLVESGLSAARAQGVTATPTIFIGDRKIVGAQPFAIYQALLDEQL